MRIGTVAGVVFSLSVLGCGAESIVEPAGVDTKKLLRAGDPVERRYIVVFDDDAPEVRALRGHDVDAFVDDFSRGRIDRLGFVYRAALRGFSAEMTEEAALELAQDPRVLFVEEVAHVSLDATQSGATWGLDRVDQRDLPLGGTYTYPNDAAGVSVYIIDTGIRRTHADFEGRAQVGFDSIGDGQGSNDCNGHGTHVAGTVAGKTWGLAKRAKLFAVRVLNCQGSGTNEGVIAGVDWVTANHVSPAVANMSLGGGASAALDTSVRNSIAAGVTYALAAGNENTDACGGSPSRVTEAITVGSTTASDARSSFSNWGTCVDLFAPGSSIQSAWNSSDSATNTISGTSMASPHVAGAAALYLAANPTASPQQVRDALVNNATAGKVSGAGTGSPNRLLYTGFIGGGGGGNAPPSLSIDSPAPGATVSGTVTVSATASDADGAIVKVTFTLPGGGTVEDTAAPWSASWNTANAPNGAATVAVTATDDGGATTTKTVTVTVSNGGGGGGGDCAGGMHAATGLPVPIPDNSTAGVTSSLAVAGAGTIASLAISLDVDHTYRGDLKVTLIAPDGTTSVVHNRTGGSADDLVLSGVAVSGFAGKPAAGTWRLLVQDLAAVDVGTLRSWSLDLVADCGGTGGGAGWSASAAPNLATVDNGTVCTSLEVEGSGDAAGVKLDLAGTHAWRSILRGTLSHGGVTRDAFPTGTFPSNAGPFSLTSRPVAGFSGSATGVWTLCIVDTDAYGDTGLLQTWSVHD